MISLLLLLSPLAFQEPAQKATPVPQVQEPSAQEAWSHLGPEEKQRLEERRKTFYALPPEARQEMMRRFRTLDDKRQFMVRRMNPEERQRLEAASPEERQRILDDRVRRHMQERSRRLEREFPDEARSRRSLPLDQRMQRSREFRHRRMRERLREGIRHAQESGWVGPAAAAWLETAPPHEAFEALGQFRKMESLQRMHKEGAWEKLGIKEEDRARLTELPPREFEGAMDRVRAGGSPEEALKAMKEGRGRHRFGDGPPHRPGDGPPGPLGEGERDRHPPRGSGEGRRSSPRQ